MRKPITITLLVTLGALLKVCLVNSNPIPSDLTKRSESSEYADEGEYFEGDIILLPQQRDYIEAQKNNETGVKTLISDPTAIWPDKTVYYEFTNEFSPLQRHAVIEALNDLMSMSCVKFVQRTTQPTYIRLRNNARGCAAAVGYHNFGPLDLFLGGPSCQTRGTIQHEFLHTLGFWHEHTRQDRDTYVTVNWLNISPGKEFNFHKRDPSEIMNLNMPYDYGSVMHYRTIAFSKDLLSQTITPINPAAASRMGQRIRFSNCDLAKLNRLYQCPPNYYLGDDLVGQGSIIGLVEFDKREGTNRNPNTGLVVVYLPQQKELDHSNRNVTDLESDKAEVQTDGKKKTGLIEKKV